MEGGIDEQLVEIKGFPQLFIQLSSLLPPCLTSFICKLKETVVISHKAIYLSSKEIQIFGDNTKGPAPFLLLSTAKST